MPIKGGGYEGLWSYLDTVIYKILNEPAPKGQPQVPVGYLRYLGYVFTGQLSEDVWLNLDTFHNTVVLMKTADFVALQDAGKLIEERNPPTPGGGPKP